MREGTNPSEHELTKPQEQRKSGFVDLKDMFLSGLDTFQRGNKYVKAAIQELGVLDDVLKRNATTEKINFLLSYPALKTAISQFRDQATQSVFAKEHGLGVIRRMIEDAELDYEEMRGKGKKAEVIKLPVSESIGEISDADVLPLSRAKTSWEITAEKIDARIHAEGAQRQVSQLLEAYFETKDENPRAAKRIKSEILEKYGKQGLTEKDFDDYEKIYLKSKGVEQPSALQAAKDIEEELPPPLPDLSGGTTRSQQSDLSRDFPSKSAVLKRRGVTVQAPRIDTIDEVSEELARLRAEETKKVEMSVQERPAEEVARFYRKARGGEGRVGETGWRLGGAHDTGTRIVKTLTGASRREGPPKNKQEKAQPFELDSLREELKYRQDLVDSFKNAHSRPPIWKFWAGSDRANYDAQLAELEAKVGEIQIKINDFDSKSTLFEPSSKQRKTGISGGREATHAVASEPYKTKGETRFKVGERLWEESDVRESDAHNVHEIDEYWARARDNAKTHTPKPVTIEPGLKTAYPAKDRVARKRGLRELAAGVAVAGAIGTLGGDGGSDGTRRPSLENRRTAPTAIALPESRGAGLGGQQTVPEAPTVVGKDGQEVDGDVMGGPAYLFSPKVVKGDRPTRRMPPAPELSMPPEQHVAPVVEKGEITKDASAVGLNTNVTPVAEDGVYPGIGKDEQYPTVPQERNITEAEVRRMSFSELYNSLPNTDQSNFLSSQPGSDVRRILIGGEGIVDGLRHYLGKNGESWEDLDNSEKTRIVNLLKPKFTELKNADDTNVEPLTQAWRLVAETLFGRMQKDVKVFRGEAEADLGIQNLVRGIEKTNQSANDLRSGRGARALWGDGGVADLLLGVYRGELGDKERERQLRSAKDMLEIAIVYADTVEGKQHADLVHDLRELNKLYDYLTGK